MEDNEKLSPLERARREVDRDAIARSVLKETLWGIIGGVIVFGLFWLVFGPN